MREIVALRCTDAGDLLLQSGTVLPRVRLAYAVRGTLNAALVGNT